ncbi:MAG: mannose-1-phosphate guanylyltransferase, partial [Gemmatimonadota bacterium]
LPNRYAVVLAGGIGSRFWPASRPDRPKQLLPLASDRPLILDTVDRARRLVGTDRVRILTGAGLVGPFQQVVPDLEASSFLVEPLARSTGPALVWAAFEIERSDPGAIMISLHSDHVIEPFDAFRDTIEWAALGAARNGSLVCLGIEPTRPETGYGYIEVGAARGEGMHAVARFHEKPDLATAEAYCASGGYLWNSGIFVWRARDLIEQARQWAVELRPSLPTLESGDVERFFDSVQPVSVDVGILERSDRVEVVRAAFTWDDVGTWAALSRTRAPDSAGNVVLGDATIVDGAGNIVWTEDGHVHLFGVQDTIVVHVGRDILVMHKDNASDIKRFLSQVESEGGAGP